VLALGAHPDDIELGAGGTLLRLASRLGSDLELNALVLTSTPERAKEAHCSFDRLTELAGAASLRVLDLRDGYLPAHWQLVKETLADIARQASPDLIIAPTLSDAHQDHRVLAELVTTVWRDHLVAHYEIPKYDGDLSRPNVFVPLGSDTIDAKWRLLDECFTSQQGKDWFDRETIYSLSRLRGIECHARYAEAFEVSKALIDF
jgi:LmbE family N-acetylglucosaminyl deacetylase